MRAGRADVTAARLALLCAGLVLGLGLAGARKPTRSSPVPIAPGTPTVTLGVRVTPAVRATVTWGRVALGETPVSLPFPRDSGPVDIVVRAPGYLTTHTRLNTFASDSVTVKLVPEAEKKTVFGFKKEAPPPVVPDGGVPPGIAAPGVAPPGIAAPGVAAPGTAPPGLARPAPAAAVPVQPGAARPATPAAPVSAPGPWTPPAAR